MKYFILLTILTGCATVETSKCYLDENKLEVCGKYHIYGEFETICNCVNKLDYWEFMDHQTKHN